MGCTVLVLCLRSRAVRLPPTPCRVCFRPCVFNKFSHFWRKTYTYAISYMSSKKQQRRAVSGAAATRQRAHWDAGPEEVPLAWAAWLLQGRGPVRRWTGCFGRVAVVESGPRRARNSVAARFIEEQRSGSTYWPAQTAALRGCCGPWQTKSSAQQASKARVQTLKRRSRAQLS